MGSGWLGTRPKYIEWLQLFPQQQRRCVTKLRIKGNSLRLRVTRSEVSTLIDAGRVEETICFSAGDQMRLTYALVCDSAVASAQVRYTGSEIAVILPRDQAMTWAGSDQVGIYAAVDLGLQGGLDIVVEKDFACLDHSDAENIDTFPNPNAGAAC